MSLDQADTQLKGAPCVRIGCDGTLKVVNSVPTNDGRFMQQYYGCNLCGCRPADNKRVIRMENSWSRRTAV